MENKIKITHFVNPYQFWFTRSQPRIISRMELLFQEALNKFCTEQYDAEETGPDGYYEPVTGEIVAVYDPARKKWTRNRVVNASNVVDENTVRHTYQVWSLDEGVPKEAAAKHMKPLPSKFTHSESLNVSQGSLRNILSIKYFYDQDEGRICAKASTEWDTSIITDLQVLIQNAEETYFKNTTTHSIAGEEIEFGDLWFLTKQQKLIDARDIILQVRAQIVDEEQFLEYMTLNRKPENPHIPAKAEKNYTNASVAACSKETLELGPVTTESLPTSAPENWTDLTNTAANNSQIIPAQLKRVSSMQHAAKPVSDQTLNANSELPASLARFINRRREPCHQPADQTNALRSKLARMLRAKINLKKSAAENSTTIEAEAIESSLNATNSTTNEQMLLTSEDAAGGILDVTGGNKTSINTTTSATNEQKLSTLKDAAGGTLDLTGGIKLVPLTIHPTGNKRSVERFLKEEQCVLSHLLVHGANVPNPIDSIAKANFCPSVQQVLTHLGIRIVNRLQSYAWPLIMRGNSLLCVNSAGTGKTFAYLPAVCSLIKMQIEKSLVLPVPGPVGIIVCHSSLEVQRISNLCRKMLNSGEKEELSVLECYGIRLVIPVCNKLLSGCALLVTTAPAYRRLYEAMPEAFVRKRIRIVVIDNIHQMLQHFGADLQLLLKNCAKPDLQIIITADYWNQALGIALSRFKNMITCIGAYLEAALYAKVQFQLRLLRNDGSKQHELVQYIRDHNYRTQRTIVFGSTTDDLDLIMETLRQHSIQHLVCNARTIVNQHDGFRYWDELLPGEMEVLICLDELVSDLCVSKAQHIVHYSLPDSWTRFTRRFATSFNYDEFPYQKQNRDESPEARPSSLVLVDENNIQQLPKLIDFLKQHNVLLPEQLSLLAQHILKAVEYERVFNGGAARALCPQLLALGNCRIIRSCAYRHTLMESDLDFGDSLPSRGTVVRLHIFHVFSPGHFSGSLYEHRAEYDTSNWTPPVNRNEFLLYDFKLQSYFSNAERHQIYGKELKPNDLCALFFEHNYRRCRIVHFMAEDESTTVGNVQLKLIDTGRIVTTKSTNLLSLPEQFHALPGQAIDVHIAGVVPLDWEEDWDQELNKHVQGWIDKHVQQSNHFVQGKVLLALRDTIWIEELMLVDQLDSLKTAVVSTNIKSLIVSKKFGIYDKASFERIQQIVQNFEAARTVDVLVEEKRLVNIQTSIISQQPEDKSNTINDQNELAVERSLDSSVGTSKQEDVVRDPIPLPTSSGQQTPLEDEHSKANNMSISSTSSIELLSPTPDKEQYRFEAFEKGNQYNVIIGHYVAPDLFYVYQIDTMIQIHEKIKTYVENSSKIEQLTHFEVGMFCLVYFEDTYRRSQIMEVTEATIKVFLLDVGGTIWCHRETLFEIPNHLLQNNPFAAIEAKLGLIEPLEGSTWTKQISDAIYDDVLGNYNDCGMVAQVLKTLDPRHEAGAADQSVEGCHRYELLLTNHDATHAFSIISELAQNKLVMVNSSDLDLDTDTEDEEDDSSMKIAHALLHTKEQSAAVPGAAAATATVEQNKATPLGTGCSSSNQLLKKNSTDTLKSIAAVGHEPAKSTAMARVGRLVCDYRIPQTEWWQDNGIITLYVSAPDVIHYKLIVNIKSLMLRFFRDDQPYALCLNLFGPIDPQYTIHEVRGLKIVIRLVRLPGSTWHWPHLLNISEKQPYLKRVMPPHRYRSTNSDGRSGSESSDEEKFEWPDWLLRRQEDMRDFCSDSSLEEKGDNQEDTTED